MIDPHAHTAAVLVNAPPRMAYEFMADGQEQSHWALGSWNRRLARDDIWVGTSLFDGRELYSQLVGRPNLLMVDYFGGHDIDDLRWMVTSRVVPGGAAGVQDDQSLILLTTWRTPAVDDATWARTFHVWRTEVHLIKGRLEQLAAA